MFALLLPNMKEKMMKKSNNKNMVCFAQGWLFNRTVS